MRRFLYEYDIASNIRMIRAIYPDTKNIAFISDNTYGGVTLQAHVRKEMKQFPDMNLILLDGREHTIYTIVDELRKLPKHYGRSVGHLESGQERRLFYAQCYVFDDGGDSGCADVYGYFHRSGLLGRRREWFLFSGRSVRNWRRRRSSCWIILKIRICG